jgi:putative solute:sodium symporter small subunit
VQPRPGKAASANGAGARSRQPTPVNTLPPEKAKAYWRRNVTIISILLTIWALVSYGAAILMANILYDIKVGQLPMSFWFAQQGAIVTFVLLIFVLLLDHGSRR